MSSPQSPKNSNISPSALGSHKSLNNSRSRVKVHSRSTHNQQQDPNIVSINESMQQLQDPAFISHEIDQFQSRLVGAGGKGFCGVTRQMSILLSNTQGYRKYKMESNQRNPIDKQTQQPTNTNPIDIITNNASTNSITINNTQHKESYDSQQISLNYSSDSREQLSRRTNKIQEYNMENNSTSSRQ